MAEALENAYLVLLGQIALILSGVMFGVPFFLSSPGQPVYYSPTTILFLVFVFAASAMMIANIIIGWAALRGSLKNPEHYTHKMFIIDILIVLTFFFMNNAILFSFGGMLALDKLSSLQSLLKAGISLHTVAFLSASLYGLTAIFLLLCKSWNKMFYRASGTKGPPVYEAILSLTIVVSFGLAVAAGWFMNDFRMQAILIPVWLLGWIYVNFHWVSLKYFAPKPLTGTPGPDAPKSSPALPKKHSPPSSTAPDVSRAKQVKKGAGSSKTEIGSDSQPLSSPNRPNRKPPA